MANEIKNEIGLDASKMIQSLNEANKAFESFNQGQRSLLTGFGLINKETGRVISANKHLVRSYDEVLDAIERVAKAQGRKTPVAAPRKASSAPTKLLRGDDAATELERLLGIAPKAGAAAENAGKRTARGAKEGAEGIRGMTVSWETLTRVVQTQLIVRTLSQIRNLIRSSLQEAIKFEQAVGRTVTIADGTGFEEIAGAARRVSDELNVGLLQTTEALNQAIQNGVAAQGDFAASVGFLEEAVRFARVTNSNAVDSVNLLSGAIKSYGLDASDAGLVASEFFAAIDKGRITASDLAGSFGQVGTAGRQVGISLKENLSLLSAITQNGLDAAQAFTQVRAIITALTAPSPALRKAFQDMGVTSADAAIRSRGLLNVLKELSAFSRGNPELLAAMFRNVRGRGGVLNIANEEFETLIDHLENIQNVSANTNLEKFMEATANEGEKLESSINRLKNAFSVDLGREMLVTINNLLEFTGGLNVATSAIQNAGPALVGFSGSVALFATGLTSVLGPIGGLVFAVPALIGLFNSLAQAMDRVETKRIQERIRQDEEASKKRIETLKKQLSEERQIQQKGFEDAIKLFASAQEDFAREFQRSFSIAISANKALVASVNQSVGAILDRFQDLSAGFRNAARDALDLRAKAGPALFDLANQLKSVEFARITRGLSALDKARRALFRTVEKGNLIAAKDDPAQLALERAKFDNAVKIAQENLGLAEASGDINLIRRAEQQLEQTLRDKIKAEQEFITVQEKEAPILRKKAAEYDRILERAKVLQQQIKDNADVEFDGQNRLSEAERKRRKGIREQAGSELKTLIGRIKKEDVKRLGLGESFAEDIQQNLRNLVININNDSIHQQLDNALKTYRQKVKTKFGIELEFLVPGARTPEEYLRGLADQAANATKLRQELDQLNAKDTERLETAKNLRRELERTSFPDLQKRFADLPTFFTQGSQNRKDAIEADRQLKNIRQTILDISNQDIISDADVQRVEKLKTDFDTFLNTTSGPVSRDLFGPTVKSIAAAVALLKQQQGQQVEGGPQRRQQLEAQLKQAQAIKDSLLTPALVMEPFVNAGQKIIDAGQKLVDGAQALSNVVIPANVTSAAQQWIDAAQAWINASRVSPPPPLPLPPRRSQFGNYFNFGGRGKDTIPAMLSKGETVIDARNSARFFPELQAIRAGFAPRFRQHGGSVNVGDINVTVKGGDTSTETVNDIAAKLNRKIRSGAIRLRRK